MRPHRMGGTANLKPTSQLAFHSCSQLHNKALTGTEHSSCGCHGIYLRVSPGLVIRVESVKRGQVQSICAANSSGECGRASSPSSLAREHISAESSQPECVVYPVLQISRASELPRSRILDYAMQDQSGLCGGHRIVPFRPWPRTIRIQLFITAARAFSHPGSTWWTFIATRPWAASVTE
jgi:hypothetical protein